MNEVEIQLNVNDRCDIKEPGPNVCWIGFVFLFYLSLGIAVNLESKSI